MSQRLQNRLRLQARVIEELFRRHGMLVHVDGGVIGSHATTYRLRSLEEGAWERLVLAELTQDLIETLGVPEVLVRRDFGEAQVEVGHCSSPDVSLLELLNGATLPPLVGLLGVVNEQPVLVNLTSSGTGHMLVVGGAGAGKSALLRSLTVSLAMHSRQAQLQFVCFVPAGGDHGGESPLRALAYLPHLMTSLVSDMEDVQEVLAFLVAEIDYRRQAGVRLPHLAILLDNVGALYAELGDAAHHSLRRLLADGEGAGLHLLAASRPPATTRQRQLLEANWPVRVVGHLAPELAQEMGAPDARGLAGQGEFLVQSQGSELRFQAAQLDDYDLQLCLDELQNHRRSPVVAQTAGRTPFSRTGDEVAFVLP